MIDFICDILGYEMQYTNNYNLDQYIIYTGCMLIVVFSVLMVYLLVRFLQWLWSVIK